MITYFIDPVLRAPMIASMLMCFSASLIGVIVFLKKQSLIGEALSHAAYPGVIFGAIFVGLFYGDLTSSDVSSVFIICCAFLTSFLGIHLIFFLERKLKVSADAALCFVLSFFFGIGITLASHIQFAFSNLYRQVQIYFYGQSATLTDTHILIYGCLAFTLTCTLFFFRKEFAVYVFDPIYAKVLGINTRMLDSIFISLVTLSIVIGIRSVGVVLMSAMLIAPAIAARQFTNRLNTLFGLAVFFGLFSAFFGNYFANELGIYLMHKYPGVKMSVPTGPMIVLIASCTCLFALFCSPKRGLIVRLFRAYLFRLSCLHENLIKTLWRQGPKSSDELKMHLYVGFVRLKWTLYSLERQGFIQKQNGLYTLTKDGFNRGSRIVRLHRLWELYLADYVGVGKEKVHLSAEEMEHIITKDLEAELTLLLNNPSEDPHQQPIPKGGL